MADSPQQTRAFGTGSVLLALGLAALAVLAFYPVLFSGFVNWDDDANILQNHMIRGLGMANIRWMFTSTLGHVYQPLGWFLMCVVHVVFDGKALGFHLMALVLHCVNVLLFYRVTCMLLVRASSGRAGELAFPSKLCAAAGAALFGVHPLRAEVVAWASALPYLPAAAFALLSVIAYLRWCDTARGGGGWRLYGLALVCFGLSLLSKAIALTLPAVLCVLDVYPLRRAGLSPRGWLTGAGRKVLVEKLPFFALSAGCVVAGMLAEPVAAKAFAGGWRGIVVQVGVAAYAVFFHLKQSLLPLGLLPLYTLPGGGAVLYGSLIAGAVFTIVVGVGVVLLRNRWPAALAVGICYLILISPVAGVVRHGRHFAADRYAYLSCLPWAVLASGLLVVLYKKWSSDKGRIRLTVAVVGIVVMALAGGAYARSRVWRNSVTLWRDAARKDPLNHFAWSKLGAACVEVGQYESAARFLLRALELNPRNADACHNLGFIYRRMRKLPRALEFYKRALELKPGVPMTHCNLGNIYVDLGDLERAEEHYREALQINPRYHDAHYNLALMYAGAGRCEDAVAQYRKCLQLNPRHYAALNNLGRLYHKIGDSERAVGAYLKALNLNPRSFQIHYNLGEAYSELGDLERARQCYRRALEIKPDFAPARRRLESAADAP